MAGNTQADDTLPSIVGRGGANCRITPGPHTQLFGGARHPPPPTGTPGTAPPPPREPPSPAPLLDPPPPPPGAFGQQLVGGVVGVQDRGVAPPVRTSVLRARGHRAALASCRGLSSSTVRRPPSFPHPWTLSVIHTSCATGAAALSTANGCVVAQPRAPSGLVIVFLPISHLFHGFSLYCGLILTMAWFGPLVGAFTCLFDWCRCT